MFIDFEVSVVVDATLAKGAKNAARSPQGRQVRLAEVAESHGVEAAAVGARTLG